MALSFSFGIFFLICIPILPVVMSDFVVGLDKCYLQVNSKWIDHLAECCCFVRHLHPVADVVTDGITLATLRTSLLLMVKNCAFGNLESQGSLLQLAIRTLDEREKFQGAKKSTSIVSLILQICIHCDFTRNVTPLALILSSVSWSFVMSKRSKHPLGVYAPLKHSCLIHFQSTSPFGARAEHHG